MYCLINHLKFSSIQPQTETTKYTNKMKTTAITACILAAVTSTLAAPTADLKPLELTNLSAGVYSSTPPTTTLFSFSLKDPNANVDTKCSGYWYDIPPTCLDFLRTNTYIP